MTGGHYKMLHNPISRGIPDFIKYNQALLGIVYGIEVYRNISRFFTHWVYHIFYPPVS